MRVLYSWLKELTDTELDAATLAERLTMTGTQIESVEETGPAYHHMVVGRVVDSAMLDARLKSCRVAVGGETVELVSAAPNVRSGITVAVALPGAVLPGGERIAARDFGGVTSQGMLLSLAELGLSTSEEGILELPGRLEPGAPLAPALGLDDAVLEAEVTANRGDCLSMIGVAREVVAAGWGNLRLPDTRPEETGPPVEETASIRIDDPDACFRYVGRVVEGLEVGPSPLWLTVRLHFMGARPLNNVVDVTNYVLFETGQPLHPFDLDLIPGGEVVVRIASGERMTTLDGVERVLPADALAICDRTRPIALAGVMGGVETEVTAGTRRMLLESAHFEPRSIRRTAKGLSLATEASYRFERGVDHQGVLLAADRAARLLAELAGGKVAKGRIDCCPRPQSQRVIDMRSERVNHLLGSKLPADDMRRILTRLGMEVTAGSKMKVRVPYHRNDVQAEADLVEEIGRISGYDSIPGRSRIPRTVPRHLTTRERLLELSRPFFLGRGFYEAMTVSLLEEDRIRLWLNATGRQEEEPLRVINPVAESMSTLRPSLSPGLLASMAINLNRRRSHPRLFEAGNVFRRGSGVGLPDEGWHLAAAASGTDVPPAWDRTGHPFDFYDLRGLLESYLNYLGLPPAEVNTSSLPVFGGELGAELAWKDRVWGIMGSLSRDLRRKWGFKQEVMFLELDLEVLAGELERTDRRYRGIPRYPAAERDLAVMVDDTVSHVQVESLVKDEGGELLEAVNLFDCYTGDPLPPGKKSLAYSLTLRSPERTLTEEEAEELRLRIGARVTRELGGSLRE